MNPIKITLPEGVQVDKTRLTSAIRFAIQGGDPDKIWRMNNVPAIAQLEEAVYDEGQQELGLLYHEVVTGLGLPPDQQAEAVIQKALAVPIDPELVRWVLSTDDTLEDPSCPGNPSLPSPTPEEAAEVLGDLRKAFASLP